MRSIQVSKNSSKLSAYKEYNIHAYVVTVIYHIVLWPEIENELNTTLTFGQYTGLQEKIDKTCKSNAT
jgi:hypothetical protein